MPFVSVLSFRSSLLITFFLFNIAVQKTKAEAGTREFEITVPPGCVAGQILAVECPGIPDAVDVEIPRGADPEDRLVVRVVVDGEGNIEVITRARSARAPPPPPQKPKGKGLFKMALFGKKVTGKTASRLLKKAVGGALSLVSDLWMARHASIQAYRYDYISCDSFSHFDASIPPRSLLLLFALPPSPPSSPRRRRRRRGREQANTVEEYFLEAHLLP